jgi:hypothetical protein
MLADQNLKEAAGLDGQSGTTVQSSAADLTPDIGLRISLIPDPPTPP